MVLKGMGFQAVWFCTQMPSTITLLTCLCLVATTRQIKGPTQPFALSSLVPLPDQKLGHTELVVLTLATAFSSTTSEGAFARLGALILPLMLPLGPTIIEDVPRLLVGIQTTLVNLGDS